MNNITALIMAAGTDDKMKSKKSKLAQTIYGKEVIKRVVNSVKKAGIEEVGVVVGENKEEIESILKDEVKYIYQEQCLGTGHAIMQAIPYLEEKSGRVLILNGNIPLITEQTIQKIVDKSIKEDEVATILTGIISEPKGYGRVIRKENKIQFSFHALNDVVVSKVAGEKLIYMELSTDGVAVNRYTADGLIIATPTGSTGYSISAGGPVVDPCMRLYVATPICAHMLSVRSAVLSSNKDIRIKLDGEYGNADAVVTADGDIQGYIKNADEVIITESEYDFELIKIGEQSFYDTLIKKLS